MFIGKMKVTLIFENCKIDVYDIVAFRAAMRKELASFRNVGRKDGEISWGDLESMDGVGAVHKKSSHCFWTQTSAEISRARR